MTARRSLLPGVDFVLEGRWLLGCALLALALWGLAGGLVFAVNGLEGLLSPGELTVLRPDLARSWVEAYRLRGLPGTVPAGTSGGLDLAVEVAPASLAVERIDPIVPSRGWIVPASTRRYLEGCAGSLLLAVLLDRGLRALVARRGLTRSE